MDGRGLRAGGHEITNTTTRVNAHATGESRQAALNELAMLMRTQAARDDHVDGVLDRGWDQSGLRRVRLTAASCEP